jgi:hypothetical protein
MQLVRRLNNYWISVVSWHICQCLTPCEAKATPYRPLVLQQLEAPRMFRGWWCCHPYTLAAFTPGRYYWYLFLLGWVDPREAERIMSMRDSSDTIGNRTIDLPACSAVPQPTASPHAPAPCERILNIFTRMQSKGNDCPIVKNPSSDLAFRH